MVNTVKAIFGAGGFSLPWAFAQGGIALVSACLLASYVFALEALKMLVRAQDTLIDSKVVSGYEQVQTYAGLTGAALGPAGDVLCKALNVITCFGISVGYIIFVSDTLISMLPAATQLTFSTARMIITSLPLWVALSWQRSFKGVNFISLMGTVSVALGMSWVTVVALANPALAANFAAIPMSNPAAFSGFFGTVAFLFFIHFTLFGVQEAMPDRRRFVPAVSKAFGLSMVISAAFGLIGAWGFGPGVKSVVITMLDGAAGTADYDPPPSLFLSSTNVYRAFPATGPTGPDAHKTVKSALRTAEWGTPGGWREVARCGDEARHGAVRRGQGGPQRALPRVPAIVFA